ncbi:uncharacterized protein LOC134827217 [Culicoides brevitarsis]|uniref:uncharacterized protein LOC134827217 n=1 Tax=Culicoides brevitarsis TaxID=469753 RepID=UPI00307BFE13
MSLSKVEISAKNLKEVQKMAKIVEGEAKHEMELDFYTIEENFVPAVILSSIFLYLEKKDRLTCKLVCKQWLQVLMTDVYFKKDRHLYLSHCVLDESCEPLTVFANAPYGYNHLSVGPNTVLVSDSWDFFGDQIQFLDISGVPLIKSTKYVKILTTMPHIRVLRVHNDGPLNAGLFGRAMELLQEQEVKLNLEELQIECVNCNPIKNEYFDVLPKICKISPKLKKITIESILERMVPELQNVLDEFPNIKVAINLVTHSDTCVWGNERGPLDMDGLELEGVEFSYEKSAPEILEKYVEEHETLKNISLSCEAWPIEPVQRKVQQLDLNLKHVRDYKDVENFPKLKALTFKAVHGCIEQHSPICHLKVAKFTVKADVRYICVKCLKAMMLSFPNIEEFELIYDCISKDCLAMVLEMLALYKGLKKVNLNCGTLQNSEMKNALARLPEHQTLGITELSFESSRLHEDVLRSFIRKFPRLQNLSMKMTGWEIDFTMTLRVVLSESPHLRHFLYDFPSINEEKDLSYIQETLIECGQHLKTVTLPAAKFPQASSEQILRSIPALHSLTMKETNVTRAENGQFLTKKLKTPHSGLCRVAHPYQRPHHEDNVVGRNNNNNAHEHRNYMEARRRARLDRSLEFLAHHFPEHRWDRRNEARLQQLRARNGQQEIPQELHMAVMHEANRRLLRRSRRLQRLEQRNLQQEHD